MTSKDLMILLHKHNTLFEEPQHLPLSRGIFDHSIVLYNKLFVKQEALQISVCQEGHY